MAGMDAIDRRILATLQREGRLTNAELAERVNLSASACHQRVRRLPGVAQMHSSFAIRTVFGATALALD